MVYSSGVVQYGYNRDNNLEQVISAFDETTDCQWDLAEELKQVTLPNESVVSLSYDKSDRLVYKGDPNMAGGIGFKYEMDMNGNRTTITENDGSVTVNTYDDKNRLVNEVRTGVSAYSCGYRYDLNDNLTYRDISPGINVSFFFDKLQQTSGDTFGTTFGWDPDGRLAFRKNDIGTITFSYDYADRVTGMTVGSRANPLTLAYFYDGDGGLQWLQRNGLRSQFLLDGRDVLREWLPLTITRGTDTVALRPRDLVRLGITAANQAVVDYTHGLGLISQRITTLTSNPQVSSTDFFRWDGRATSRRQEDPSKADTNDTIFDAYGLLRSTKTLTSAYGFVGEEGVRQEKGQAPDLVVPYHMRARMYDPLLGRFTSRDPVWDVNLYDYCKDNPWSNIDPSGMQVGSGGESLPLYKGEPDAAPWPGAVFSGERSRWVSEAGGSRYKEQFHLVRKASGEVLAVSDRIEFYDPHGKLEAVAVEHGGTAKFFDPYGWLMSEERTTAEGRRLYSTTPARVLEAEEARSKRLLPILRALRLNNMPAPKYDLDVLAEADGVFYFDGTSLVTLNLWTGQRRRFVAASGKAGAGPGDQSKKDYGPIPEGTYTARSSQIWHPSLKAEVGLQTLRWGETRLTLHPTVDTPMQGRNPKNFFIHGGGHWASAGCISCGHQIMDVLQPYMMANDLIVVIVAYPRPFVTTGRMVPGATPADWGYVHIGLPVEAFYKSSPIFRWMHR